VITVLGVAENPQLEIKGLRSEKKYNERYDAQNGNTAISPRTMAKRIYVYQPGGFAGGE
jgi:hypothetical protein